MNWKNYLSLFLAVAFFISLVIWLPKTGFEWDIISWYTWASWINDMGIAHIYETSVNYHPIWLYILGIYGAIQGAYEPIVQNVNVLKTVPLFFDFLSAFSIFLWVKFTPKNAFLPFFLLLNIAFLYNSLLWGQLDSIPSLFVLLAFYFALKKRLIWSTLFYLLALNTKLQAIIFLPILGLLLLPQWIRQPRKILTTFAAIFLLQALLILPFIVAGTTGGLWQVVTGAVGHHPMISLNAFNFWYLYYFPALNPGAVNDSIPLFYLTAKKWGLLLFFLFSALVLLPLAFAAYRSYFEKMEFKKISELVLLTGGLITVVFFYFNTQMHERYVHNALLFFFIFGLLRNNYWLYFTCSVAYFLNLEKVLFLFPWQKHHTDLLNPRLIAWLYTAILLYGIYQLYRHYFPQFAKAK